MNSRIVAGLALVTGLFAVGNPVWADDDEEKEGLGLYAIGLTGALSKPSSVGNSLGFGIHADLGEVMPNLVLFPSLTYWSKSQTLVDYGSYKADVVNQEIGLQGDLHYYLNPEANVNYYIGAGAGLFSAKTGVEADKYGVSADVQTKSAFGLNVLAGLEVPISNRAVFVGEARYKVDGNRNLFRIGAGFSITI